MSAYSDLIVADGPGLYWTLDALTGATDLSGNGRNGTGAGGVTIGGFADGPIIGAHKSSTDFDGIANLITSPYACFVGGSTRSFEGWVNRDVNANFNIIFGGSGGSTPPDLYLDAGNDGFNFEPRFSGGPAFGAIWVGYGAWGYFALTWIDGVSGTANICGHSTAPVADAGTYSSPGNFQVGDAGGAGVAMNGKIAHIAVYEYALSLDQMRNHYNAGIGATLDTSRPPLLTGPGVETTLGDIG